MQTLATQSDTIALQYAKTLINAMPKPSNQPFLALSPDARPSRLHWLAPVFVIALYLGVMVAFFSLQKIQTNLLPYFIDNNEKLQYILNLLIIGLSGIILISLIFMWRSSRHRIQTEYALQSETVFRRAMENSMSTGMRVIDMQGKIIYVNPAFCRLIGWDENALIGQSMPYPYWIPGRHHDHMRTMDALLAGQAPSTGLELEVQRRDGSRFTARMYVSPMRDPNGQQIGWMTSMTDITEPKRIRQALAAAHERFMTVLESLDDAISVVADTPKGPQLRFANRTYRHCFGSNPDGHEALRRQQQEQRDHNKPCYMADIDTWFEVQHRNISWTDGCQVRMQVASNITERLRHEEASRQQQEKIQITSRLTTMGEMASTLAHELNQPLTAIVNYNSVALALLASGQVDNPMIKTAMEKSAAQAERAGKIISRVRAFVKRSDPRRQSCPLSSIVNNTLELAEIDARKYGMRIHNHISEDLPPVYADPILIEQVLLNLVRNGLEAMISTGEKDIELYAEQQAQSIEIAVHDRGCGIKDPERLFEPFFSTKAQGLGMGLNICRTIIESHQGQLWTTPNPVGGTIFRFRLPIASDPIA